jgi:hypothetical protein
MRVPWISSLGDYFGHRCLNVTIAECWLRLAYDLSLNPCLGVGFTSVDIRNSCVTQQLNSMGMEVAIDLAGMFKAALVSGVLFHKPSSSHVQHTALWLWLVDLQLLIYVN